MLSPVADYYSKLSEEMIECVISFDIFITALGYCGVSDIGELAKNTGGEIYYYQELGEQGLEALHSDLWKAVTKIRGWEAGIKFRPSQD